MNELGINELKQQNLELQKEILYLKEELSNLKRLIFGKKAERFVSEEPPFPPNTLFSQQDQLSNEKAQENLTETISYTRQKPVVKKGGRKTLPAHLHREVIVIEPRDKSEDWNCIGKEVTEELDYKPGVMFVNRYERPKYVDPQTESIHIAPMPGRVVDKCIAGPAFMSHVLIEKYMDHNPLHRQLSQYKRIHQVDIPKSTFGDWTCQYVNALLPLYDAHLKEVLSSSYLQTDESPFKVQDHEKEGKCHKGYMWVSRDPQKNLVLFTYQKGRSGQCLYDHIGKFKGKLQVDGYEVYNYYEDDPQVILFGCWAHARRYFEQALQNDKTRSEFVLKKIQELYKIERYCRENEYTIDQRQKWRQEHSISVLNEIKQYLDREVNSILPDLAIGKAFGYTLTRWEKLIRYAQHGEVEIDNNLVENSIRPLALGRKNYLFAGSHESAQRSAVMYSLLGTCKILGINPYNWLTDVFNRIKDHPIKRISELLPQNWQHQHS